MKNKTRSYNEKIHFIGRISVAVFAACSFSLPLILWLKYGLLPTKEGFVSGLINVYSLMIPITVAEFLSYAPIVGAAGYYCMVLTGNFSNIRIPSSIVALQASEIDGDTEDGEVISSVAIAVSAITTEVVLLLGVLLITPLTPFLTNPVIKPALDQIVPALFGAITVSFILKNPKSAIVPLVVGFVIIKLSLVPFTYTIPTIVALSVLLSRIFYKLGFFNLNDSNEKSA